MAKIDQVKVRREFDRAVNMTAAELGEWLGTDESRSVGFKRDGDLSDNDYAHMRKVVGYVHRHLAQRPENIYTSRWRYSLMNWGHDPTKEA
jgi:hypothetical protein